MNYKKILPIASVLVAVVLLAGLFTFAGACPVVEGEKPMKCHWSEMALKGIACLMIVSATIRVILSNIDMARGMALSEILIAVLAIAIPLLIGTCMKAEMHCNTHMKPFTILLSLIYAILAGTYLFLAKNDKKIR